MALKGKVDSLCRLTPGARPPLSPYLPPGAPPATTMHTSVEPYVRIVLRDAEIHLPSLPLPPDAPRRVRVRRVEAPPTEEDAPYTDECKEPIHTIRVAYVRTAAGAYQRTFVSIVDVQRACGFRRNASQIVERYALLDLSDIAFAYADRKAAQEVVLHTHRCGGYASKKAMAFASAEWMLERMREARAESPELWNDACELVAGLIREKNDAWLAMRGEEDRPEGLLREPYSRYRPPVVAVTGLI